MVACLAAVGNEPEGQRERWGGGGDYVMERRGGEGRGVGSQVLERNRVKWAGI